MRDILITGIVDLSNGERTYDELIEWSEADLVFEAVGYGMKIDRELAEEYGISLDEEQIEVEAQCQPNTHIRSQIRPFVG